MQDGPRRPEPIVPRVEQGTVLGGDQVAALCRARDLGAAAAVAAGERVEPVPAVLAGIEPSVWPELVAEGRRAIADLVTSVVPIVYALSRGRSHGDDLRSQMFEAVVRAAHRYDPEHPSGAQWSTYAWNVASSAARRGVDVAGVTPGRSRPTMVSLDTVADRVSSTDPGPEDYVGVGATIEAVNRLPAPLRAALLHAMEDGGAATADRLQVSERTVHRRVAAARSEVSHTLGLTTRPVAR